MSALVGKTPISLCERERLAEISLVCCDMDGTWLSPAHGPTDGGMKALAEAEEMGLLFCFATGRCPLSAAEASRMPSVLEKPGIYSNGAVVLGRGGKKLYSLDLPKDIVNKVVNLVLGQQINENKCEGVAVLLNDCNDFFIAVHGSEEYAQHLHKVYHDPKPIELPESTAAIGCFPLTQLIHVVGSPEDIDALFPLLQDAVGKSGAASVARNLPTDCVITCPDAHKGFAVGKLKEHLRNEGMIPPAGAEEGGLVMCIGDSGNDVTMLRSAGDVSVAMANARQETLEAAEFYTVYTNGDKTCPGVLETVVAVAGAKRAKNEIFHTTAFVGLGAMGYGMAKHLAKITSESVLLWNRTSAVADRFVAESSNSKFKVVADLGELSRAEVVCMCLPTTNVVEQVCEELMQVLNPGTIVIDSTSGEPTKSIEIAEKLEERASCHYIDAPVSGGPHGAAAGTLTVMVGGKDPGVIEQSLDFIRNTFGKKVVSVGPVGSAHAVKSINNCLNSSHLLIASEGLCALKAMGVSPDVALSVINSSSGRSLQTQARLPEKVLTRSFDYGFKLGLMKKDVGIANGLLDSYFPDATLMRETKRLLESACDRLGADADYTECVKELEARSNVRLEPNDK